MYAETEQIFPYFHSFPQEIQQFGEFGCSYKPNASMGTQSSFIQPSAVSDYNLWGAPIIEEPVMGLDPTTAAMSMISCGEDVMSSQSLTVSDIESSIESGQLLSEVFYECRKDILAKEGNEMPLSEVLNISIPVVKTDENVMTDENLGVIQKSVSSSSLRSMDYVHDAPLRPNFLDFPAMDFEAVYGMRRAYSEGDIKTLDNGNMSYIQSPMAQPRAINTSISEHRREQLSRYWSKKSKRNFGRKIKYACRKALADSQPRIRGRFAKTDESEVRKSDNGAWYEQG